MMTSRVLYVSLPASILAGALLAGTAPMAWAQCEMAAAQSGTATEGSGIQTEQGGVTTGASGEQTGQGAGEMTGDTAMADVDSPEIEGPDEEQVKSLLEQQGYSEVSSIYSCGTYYEAEAAKDGQKETLIIDLSTARITSKPQ